MGLDRTPVALLTLILGLGSSTTLWADELIPNDIAYTPPTERHIQDTSSSAPIDEPVQVEPRTDEEPALVDTSENIPQPHPEANLQPVPGPSQEAKTLALGSCSQNPVFHKSLAIGSFRRLDPTSSSAGNLYEAEQGIAQLLRDHLGSEAVINTKLMTMGVAENASEPQRQQQAQHIAQRMGTQFVLQGFIVDMSMDDPDSTYHPGLYRQAANLFYALSGSHTRDKRNRQFAFNLELRDGFTGEALFNKTYRTSGFWTLNKPVGFNSAEFHQSHYARNIDTLVSQASQELAHTMACQPFMISVDAPPGRTQVILAGGANNGLRAGDQLDLYQLVVNPSTTEYMMTETRLIKRNTRIQLNEVYPSHSTATLLEGEYLNGTFLAVSD